MPYALRCVLNLHDHAEKSIEFLDRPTDTIPKEKRLETEMERKNEIDQRLLLPHLKSKSTFKTIQILRCMKHRALV